MMGKCECKLTQREFSRACFRQSFETVRRKRHRCQGQATLAQYAFHPALPECSKWRNPTVQTFSGLSGQHLDYDGDISQVMGRQKVQYRATGY